MRILDRRPPGTPRAVRPRLVGALAALGVGLAGLGCGDKKKPDPVPTPVVTSAQATSAEGGGGSGRFTFDNAHNGIIPAYVMPPEAAGHRGGLFGLVPRDYIVARRSRG